MANRKTGKKLIPVRIVERGMMPLLLPETTMMTRLPMELVYEGWERGQESPLFTCPICKTVILRTYIDPEQKKEVEAIEKELLKKMKDKKGDGNMMMEGIVKFFNKKRGFGFIAGNDKKDYFVHYTGITKEENRRYLEPGQIVRFGIVQGKKGPAAMEVIVLKESA